MISPARLILMGGKRTRPSWDFTGYTPGGISVPSGLGFSRASSIDVQTNDTTMILGVAVDTPVVGQRTSPSTTRGLTLQASRTNYDNWARAKTSAVTSTYWSNAGATAVTADAAAGPDGSGTPADRLEVAANTSIGASSGQPLADVVGLKNIVSVWVRAVSGTTDFQMGNGTSGSNAVRLTLNSIGTTWQRAIMPVRTVPLTSFGGIGLADQRNLGGGSQGASDVYVDLLLSEKGEYPTDSIVTTGAGQVTRAGPKLWVIDAQKCTTGGQITYTVAFIACGARSEYISDGNYIYLIYENDSNYVRITTSTGRLHVTINGNTWFSSVTMTWNRNDLVEISFTVGGAHQQSRAFYRIGGGSTTSLGTSSSPQPYWALGSTLYLAGNSTGTEILSGWYQTMDFGDAPAWAA